MNDAPLLVLVRHGQSTWNKENRFTGWVDVGLSEEGIQECHRAAEALHGTAFDIAFTSALSRAEQSLKLILEGLSLIHIPVVRDAALNERRYGDLQGMNKDEARARFGKEQVEKWRRGFRVRPPAGESLADMCERVLPFFRTVIVPALAEGKDALVVAHGNSLRALATELDTLSEEEVSHFEIPFGVPLFYAFRDGACRRYSV